GASERDVRSGLLEQVRAAVQDALGGGEGRTRPEGPAAAPLQPGGAASGGRERAAGRPDAGERGVAPLRDADIDLFGEPTRSREVQGELLPRRGPQGLAEALEEAEATV